MYKNKVLPLNYKFHSITNLYKGLSEEDLNLEIYEYGSDALEVKLINTNYKKQHSAIKVQFIYFYLCIIACTSIFFLFKTFDFINSTAFALILWFVLLLWRLSRLVESENLIFCNDFGIHLQIQKPWGKHNRFVTASNIHDLVINEVLEDLEFRYLLILRTKGVLFHKKPIICIFKIFKPSYECLSLVYKHLNRVIIKIKNV